MPSHFVALLFLASLAQGPRREDSPYHQTIERVLNEHAAVKASLVFGVTGQDERGDTVVACVATRQPVNADALRKFLQVRLDSWQVPREWWFVDSLPPNQRGKVSRAEWRKKFLEQP